MKIRKPYTLLLMMITLAHIPSVCMAGSYGLSFDSVISSVKKVLLGEQAVEKETKKHEKSYGIRELPFDQIITNEARRQKLDPCLLHAIIKHESNYRHDAVSSRGARGLMQLMPATAKELGVNDYFDPQENIAGGALYYRMLLNQFGEHRLALIAYNSGPGTVTRGIHYKQSKRYANKVITTWNKLYHQTYYPKQIPGGKVDEKTN